MGIRKAGKAGWLALLGLGWQALVRPALVMAQDIHVDVNPERSSGPPWYGIWWVWLLAAVFVIVIVALTTRGGGRRPA